MVYFYNDIYFLLYHEILFQYPQLFYQKPETLKENVKNSAEMFEISEKEFVKAWEDAVDKHLIDFKYSFDITSFFAVTLHTDTPLFHHT